MTKAGDKLNCSEFEDRLTDYLDKALDVRMNSAVAEHALSCPLCHSLLNEVKGSLDVCRTLTPPNSPMTRLEARVLSATVPATGLTCDDFEGYLTDYLDGFLPANVFHRWERHAVLCSECEDLPGMVVRSIAACYTYKFDELEAPAGLNERILEATLKNTEFENDKAGWASRVSARLGGLRFPIPVPQLAPVAMMMLLAIFVFSQSASADGTATNMYRKSLELAESTYQQSSEAWKGVPVTATPASDSPATGDK